mgnify:CR=1 FL=1
MAITKLKALGVTDGTLTNTQINASAAIAKSKLAALDIVNADINASAAIAATKVLQDYALIHTIEADDDAAVTFTSSHITDDYMDYKIIFRNVTCVTDGRDLYLHPSIDNGSNYNLPTEQFLEYHELKNSTAFGSASAPNNSNRFNIMASLSNVSTEGTNGAIELVGLRRTTTTHKGVFWNALGGISISTGHDSGNDYWWNGGGKIITSSKINNLRLSMEGGNITKGRFSLYGIKS